MHNARFISLLGIRAISRWLDMRKRFTPSEAVAVWLAMESYKTDPRNKQLAGKLPASKTRTTRKDRAAKVAGLSAKTLSQAKAAA